MEQRRIIRRERYLFVVVDDPVWKHSQSDCCESKRGQFFVLPDNGLLRWWSSAMGLNQLARLRTAIG